jgi:hypothetical protein
VKPPDKRIVDKMLKNIKTKIKQGTYNSLFPSKRKPEKQMPASDIEEKK